MGSQCGFFVESAVVVVGKKAWFRRRNMGEMSCRQWIQDMYIVL